MGTPVGVRVVVQSDLLAHQLVREYSLCSTVRPIGTQVKLRDLSEYQLEIPVVM